MMEESLKVVRELASLGELDSREQTQSDSMMIMTSSYSDSM